MDPREKLNAIQEQKRRLRERIDHLNTTQANHQAEDPQLQRLIEKKQQVEEQRRRNQQFSKLQKEYTERRKQMERQKQLEKVQNEKRVLQLQVAMKRAVFEGVKQKVRGMNSEQVMRPNYFGAQLRTKDSSSQQPGFKQAFEGYLLNEGSQKEKPKYDIKQLNEERLVLFEKKEETIMRQILLKELVASEEPIDIDVFSLNREELELELQTRGIDFEEFMHPVKKEQILDQYPNIEKAIHSRIQDKRRDIEAEKDEAINAERQRRALRDEVSALPFKDVQVVTRLLYDIFDSICDDYQKRHVPLSKEDKSQRIRNLEEQYQEICESNLVQEMANEIVEQMLQGMRKEMVGQAAEEVAKLNEFAHQRIEQCFKSLFGEGNVHQKIKEFDQYKVPLLFVNEQENEVGKPKNQKYLKKVDNDFNIYQTEQTTTSLINDISLLDAQEKYIEKVNTQVKKNQDYKIQDTVFVYDRELYAITKQTVKTVSSGKVQYTISPPLQNIISAQKVHNHWLIYSQQYMLLLTPWGKEVFGQQLGARISNPSGNLTLATFYPVHTLLGNPTSALLSFQKGQVLKFNFNRNRITDKQTNITHYLPVVEHTKSGDQPAFPLANRNYLQIDQQKPKPTDQIHEYRQFFEHHTEPIIFVGFYRIDRIITIDRSLKCALWEYVKGRGTQVYEPVFKFQIKSTYQVYSQDENPRYKDIYPVNDSKETPVEMYQRYMLTQAFLKLQLYNNPKKQIAYFKSPGDEGDGQERPIWKVTYKQSRGEVNKILSSYYNVVDGKITAQQAQIQGDSVVILCQREHIIRNDLKTIKLYSWNIPEKRLGKVGIEIDMFKDQRVSNFVMMPSQFRGAELELVLIVNSGRLLLFSMVSGQLLRNINQELSSEENYSQIYFRSIVGARDRGTVFGVAESGVMELGWEDNNSVNDRNKLNKTIDTTKRKYFR